MEFVVLLRAVNVGGKNKISMKALKETLTKSGFQNVESYIQSGNLVLESDDTTEKAVAQSIQTIIQQNFQLSIHVIAITSARFYTIMTSCPFMENEDERVLIYFSNASLKNHSQIEQDAQYLVSQNTIFVQTNHAELNKIKSEKVIKQLTNQPVTSRNLKTSLKLLSMLKEKQ
ncbi:DUF1697 domain-containing protein [Listeria sp. PSOL-1]|uniref:DUF1697 domain-containing protein n=1 Tax=Listeria sp. PSOL-1 TaxID=1844999 RepID=UPI0013D57191|nr:DUF1697 domain-containing protein [Listeria sp. PSOL-1]